LSEESRAQEIEDLKSSIRECNDCEIQEWHTPCVFGSQDSKILIVSERPPKGEYEKELGKQMAEGTLEKEPRFCQKNWLDISGHFSPKHFFWIHRANCFSDYYEQCSCKFLEKAIRLVRPKLMLIFGGVAAEYFFPAERRVIDLVNRGKLVYRRHGISTECRVLFHWSRENLRLETDPAYKRAHQTSITEARALVREVYT